MAVRKRFATVSILQILNNFEHAQRVAEERLSLFLPAPSSSPLTRIFNIVMEATSAFTPLSMLSL